MQPERARVPTDWNNVFASSEPRAMQIVGRGLKTFRQSHRFEGPIVQPIRVGLGGRDEAPESTSEA